MLQSWPAAGRRPLPALSHWLVRPSASERWPHGPDVSSANYTLGSLYKTWEVIILTPFIDGEAEAKALAPGHTALKGQCQDLSPESLIPKSVGLTTTPCCHLEEGKEPTAVPVVSDSLKNLAV